MLARKGIFTTTGRINTPPLTAGARVARAQDSPGSHENPMIFMGYLAMRYDTRRFLSSAVLTAKPSP